MTTIMIYFICLMSLTLRGDILNEDFFSKIESTAQIVEQYIDYDVPETYKISVDCLLQNPELPTGCEITSLTNMLRYLGYDVDKVELAENYLDKALIGTATAWEKFLGNPSVEESYGCFAPVIENCGNKYLEANGGYGNFKAQVGVEFEELLKEIREGKPVIVWTTIAMEEPYPSTTWKLNGEIFTWPAEEHCMLLTGYDNSKNLVYVADPLKGNTSYNMGVFKDRYNKLYMQSVIYMQER